MKAIKDLSAIIYHSSKWICNPFLEAQLTIARAQVVANLSLSLFLTVEMAISFQRRGEH
jgi:hypothetical protein